MEARVVCRQLGFPGVIEPVSGRVFRVNSNVPVLIDYVRCNGSEDHLEVYIWLIIVVGCECRIVCLL